jgi:BASS family bile acid:Na+ symporter
MKLGLILVGICPGGTASNVIVYLFKGDVSLFVFMTFLSTVTSVILTPLLLQLYAGSYMDVHTNKMIGDIFVLVLLPLVVGYFLQRMLKSEWVLKLEKTFSIIAAIVIALIIATIVATNAQTIATISAMLFIVVVLHNPKISVRIRDIFSNA